MLAQIALKKCAQVHLPLSIQVRKGLIYPPAVVSYHKMATCKRLTARTPSPDFSYFLGGWGYFLIGCGRDFFFFWFKDTQLGQLRGAQSHLAA